MNTQSLVSWTYTLSDVTGYSLERSMNLGGVWAEILLCNSTTTSYYDNNLVWDDYPWYRVSARNSYGQGPRSSISKVNIERPLVFAFSSDGGVEAGGAVSWEDHTASMLSLNQIARETFGARKFLTAGDNACQGPSVRGGYDGQCGNLIGPSQSIYASMGNHDVSDMGGVSAFKSYFGYSNEYYTWKEGNVQGFVLYETNDNTGTQLSQSTAQYMWLSQSLSSSMQDSTIAWRIAQCHATALCSPSVHIQNAWLHNIPWEDWGINAVFSGHNHVVERLESGSVAFFMCGGISNQKAGYQIAVPSSDQKYWYTDANTGVYDYNSSYVYMIIEAGSQFLSMSFYKGATKLPDGGTTSIPNAVMSGYSLVLVKP